MSSQATTTASTVTAYDLIPILVNAERWKTLDLTPNRQRYCMATAPSTKARCQSSVNRKPDHRPLVNQLKLLNPKTCPTESHNLLRDLFQGIFCWRHVSESLEVLRDQFELDFRQNKNTRLEDDASQVHRSVASTGRSSPTPSIRCGTRSDPIAREAVRRQNTAPANNIELEPYGPHVLDNKSIQAYIIKIINKEFHDARAGRLYSYAVEEIPDHYKIGLSKDVTKRVAKWARDCRQQIVDRHETASSVSCVKRLERLVFAELHASRYKWSCAHCARPHEEWFKVSARHATAVMHKWTAFMEADPYEPHPSVTGAWRLRSEYQDKPFLHKMCTPLPADEARSPEQIMADVRDDIATLLSPSTQSALPAATQPASRATASPDQSLVTAPVAFDATPFAVILVVSCFLSFVQQHRARMPALATSDGERRAMSVPLFVNCG